MLLCEKEIIKLVRRLRKIQKIADKISCYPISDEIGLIIDEIQVLDYEGVLKCKKQ